MLQQKDYKIYDNIDHNLKFANTGITLNLESVNHGYVVATISYSGSLDYVYATFYQKGGESVSVSTELDGP